MVWWSCLTTLPSGSRDVKSSRVTPPPHRHAVSQNSGFGGMIAYPPALTLAWLHDVHHRETSIISISQVVYCVQILPHFLSHCILHYAFSNQGSDTQGQCIIHHLLPRYYRVGDHKDRGGEDTADIVSEVHFTVKQLLRWSDNLIRIKASTWRVSEVISSKSPPKS